MNRYDKIMNDLPLVWAVMGLPICLGILVFIHGLLLPNSLLVSIFVSLVIYFGVLNQCVQYRRTWHMNKYFRQ